MGASSSCPVADCSNQPPWTSDNSSVVPYSDIGGTGVIIGFVGTAYFVVILVTIYYFCAFDPSEDVFEHGRDLSASSRFRVNMVDKVILGHTRHASGRVASLVARHLPMRLREWLKKVRDNTAGVSEKAFTKSLLSMCDVQIATGLAILISGYLSLSCGISIYHWQIVVYMAWFSNITHLSALSFLRKYLHVNKWERAWRVFFMVILTAMLLVAMGPTWSFIWDTNVDGNLGISPASYAKCFFDIDFVLRMRTYTIDYYWKNSAYKPYVDPPAWQLGISTEVTIMSAVLLLFNFVSRIIKLFRPISDAVNGRVRGRLGRWGRAVLRWLAARDGSLLQQYLLKPALAALILGRLYFDLFASMLSEVYWIICSVLWATLRLMIRTVNWGHNDSDWTFGQSLPVLRLVLPMITTVEFFIPEVGESASRKEPGTREPTSAAAKAENSARVSLEVISVAAIDDVVQQPTPIQDRLGFLHRQYYDAPWMGSALMLISSQVVSITATVFTTTYIMPTLDHGREDQDILSTIVTLLGWVLLTQPMSCWLHIYVCLVLDDLKIKRLIFYGLAVIPAVILSALSIIGSFEFEVPVIVMAGVVFSWFLVGIPILRAVNWMFGWRFVGWEVKGVREVGESFICV